MTAALISISDRRRYSWTGSGPGMGTTGTSALLEPAADLSSRILRIFQSPEYKDYLFKLLHPPVTATETLVAGMSTARAISPLMICRIDIGDAHSPELREALRDLNDAGNEAREENYPIPSDMALLNARRLLFALYAIFPHRFEVYPTQDGELAIAATGGPRQSILLLCESDGGALCLVNMNDRHRRARYPDTVLLPDGFVREALQELARKNTVAK